jgi:hypothetical protein
MTQRRKPQYEKDPKLEGLREQNYIRKSPKSRLLKILVPVIALDIVFVILGCIVVSLNYPYLPILNDNNDKTSLTFDGKSVYADGGLMFVVDNNNKSPSKIMNIYGMTGRITTNDINVSHITDDANIINKNNRPTISKVENSNGNPKEVFISIPSLQRPGSYQGWIYLKGKL